MINRASIIAWFSAWMVGLAGAAAAGDFANVQPIGFSADGTVFAYEEYGVEDGSGFPYASIYVIDTVKDAYLKDTPIRVRLDDEAAGIGKARREALGRAQPLIDQYGLADHPGLLAAFNPFTEQGPAPDRLRYNLYAADPAVGAPYTLVLQPFSLKPSAACKDRLAGETAFRLKLTERDGQTVDQTLYQDAGIPDSRDCPTGYRLGGVVTYLPEGGNPIHVALVLVLSFGFEGSDGRWIAVPVRP